MLGLFEKRQFLSGEKVWLGRYRDLTNVLHWHFECEVIRIVEGSAKIKIGDYCFAAGKDDCFFCSAEELHYIVCEANAQVDIAIFDEKLFSEITQKFTLSSPKLPEGIPVKEQFALIKKELSQKGQFYREAMEHHAKGLLLNIFQHCQVTEREETMRFHKDLIARINRDFSFLTFEDAVRYSGYSPSHFSKMFKKLAGMSFSEYLNILKVENAIMLLRDHRATVASVSRKCGFSTIRNFNCVFKKITGYTPLSLPKDFIIDTGLHILGVDHFDSTGKASVLMQ